MLNEPGEDRKEHMRQKGNIYSRCLGNHKLSVPMEPKVKPGGRMLEGKAGGIIMIGNTYVALWYYTLFKAPYVY